MYSTASKFSLFSIILGVINIVMTVFLLQYFRTADLEWYVIFGATTYLITSAVVLILLGCGLRSVCQDMLVNSENNFAQIVALKKRAEELEQKSKI